MKENIKVAGIVLGIVALSFGAYLWLSAGNATPQPPTLQEQSASTPTPTPTSASTTTQSNEIMKHLITLKTSLGDITFATFDDDAPKTVQNFITLANKGFYNNVIFHRVISGFMIQGGDPTGTGTGGPGYSFADELNPSTPSYQAGYVRGVVAMANAGPNTNGSQFFIMLQDTSLPHNYTIFGKVVSGQDVVDAIGNLPTNSNDRPLNPPVIKNVVVADNPSQ
ncbi:MAG TPA: peptidylprolyl isomerase [Candidatus Paceibacterota bacterium]|nr:peptidylprolyl isomerase [Candidatus Paceibacterota bacterium]